MTEIANGAGPPAPSRINRVVTWTALLGTVSALSTVLSWSHRTVPPVRVAMSEHWLALLLLLITFIAEFTAVRIRRADQIEALTLLEAAMVADVLLLPPAVATVIAITGLALASLVDPRRAMVKKIFNLGAHATGTALLVTTVSTIAHPGEGLSGTMVAALLLGTLTFAALNLVLLSWVLSAAIGTPIEGVDVRRLAAVAGHGGRHVRDRRRRRRGRDQLPRAAAFHPAAGRRPDLRLPRRRPGSGRTRAHREAGRHSPRCWRAGWWRTTCCCRSSSSCARRSAESAPASCWRATRRAPAASCSPTSRAWSSPSSARSTRHCSHSPARPPSW